MWRDDYFILQKRSRKNFKGFVRNIAINVLKKYGYFLCREKIKNEREISEGLGWPRMAETMIGLKRLDNLEYCCTEVIRNNVDGDFIEAGVWRGGATIFMKAILKTYQQNNRKVWVADSFEGLPVPDPEKYPADKGDQHYKWGNLSINIEEVRANFKKYGLLDEDICFLKGWFKNTLPQAPINKLAVIRLDGDIYESTWDSIVSLYPKLQSGGFIIVDDYFNNKSCEQAITDYRSKFGIAEEIIKIDWTGAYWQKINT